MKRITISVGSVALLIITTLFINRGHSVVYVFREKGSPTGDPSWVILNPFRDRTPEMEAEMFLRMLQSRDVDVALRTIKNLPYERLLEISEREKEHHIKGWTLTSRQDDRNGVRLVYRTSRGYGEAADSPVWITMMQDLHGTWAVKNFEAWY